MMMHAGGINGLSHEGKHTGIIFSFLNYLRFLQNKLKPTVTVFTCDSRTSLRTELFPEYKLKREQKKKEDPELKEMLTIMRPQVQRLQYKILPYLGFNNVLCTKGLEADDIMASIVRSYKSAQITLITSDKDLYQCLTTRCSMFSPRTKKLFTIQDLKEDWGCTPEEWAEVKARSGCTTDCVPGVDRVGDKTALKYIQGKMNPKTKTYQKIKAAEEDGTVDFTRKLTVLPFKNTPKYTIQPNEFNKKHLLKLAKQFNFQHIVQTYQDWNIN